jgi:hypothetical protein
LWDKPAIVAAILDFLRERNTPVTEYDLIQHLGQAGYFAAFEQDSFNLRLFKKHFVTRHCLYSLQQDLEPDWFLRLGALEIHLQQVEPTAVTGMGVDIADGVGNANCALRNFYLDLTQLEQADENSVGELLKQFWDRFYVWQSGAEAYQVLALQPGAAWEDIERAYRRAVQQVHPDRGGSAEEFARVRRAYETLKKL